MASLCQRLGPFPRPSLVITVGACIKRRRNARRPRQARQAANERIRQRSSQPAQQSSGYELHTIFRSRGDEENYPWDNDRPGSASFPAHHASPSPLSPARSQLRYRPPRNPMAIPPYARGRYAPSRTLGLTETLPWLRCLDKPLACP